MASIESRGLTQRLADYLAEDGRKPVSPELQRIVRTGFIDTVAVMVAGRDEPVVHIARRWALSRGSASQGVRLLLGEQMASARDAALVNGVASHALDYDDVGVQGHPSAVLVSALLAEGERLGSSGAELMAAYVAGHQVWAELISRDADLHHLKGVHPTGVFGTLGATAAVAALRGLDSTQARNALGLAATMASGLTANFGSMAKPFHAGRAAALGIDAADLAEAGMTAAPDVLEHPKGFLFAASPAGRVDLSAPGPDFGKPPRLAALGLTVKKYPMCFAAHRILDAALDLVRANDVQPERVRTMTATVGPAQASMLRNARPTNGLQAKFSLQFAVAAPLVAHACGLAQLEDHFVQRPDVQALFERLQVHTVESFHPTEPTLAAADRLVLRMDDGRVLDSGEVRFARGEPSDPLHDDEMESKFMDCTRLLSRESQLRLWKALSSLSSLESIADLRTAE